VSVNFFFFSFLLSGWSWKRGYVYGRRIEGWLLITAVDSDKTRGYACDTVLVFGCPHGSAASCLCFAFLGTVGIFSVVFILVLDLFWVFLECGVFLNFFILNCFFCYFLIILLKINFKK
jgi:hypothetical protein